MKGRVIAAWTLQVVLAGLFLMAGGLKLAASPQMVQGFQEWGFSKGFLFFIGGAEALGGLALLIPRLSAVSAMGLMVIMVGAAYTHLINGDGFGATLPSTVLFLLLGIVVYLRWVFIVMLFSFFRRRGSKLSRETRG